MGPSRKLTSAALRVKASAALSTRYAAPRPHRFTCFEAATDERQRRCGGSGYGLAAKVFGFTSMPGNSDDDLAEINILLVSAGYDAKTMSKGSRENNLTNLSDCGLKQACLLNPLLSKSNHDTVHLER